MHSQRGITMTIFQTRLIALALSSSLLALSGCANMTNREKNTAVGAVIGGVAGSVIGGGVLGTAAGAAAGGVIGHQASQK
jgi:osmotically inducible lipoprotein OsmB